ncbi:MAG: hypothetical protein HY826_14795 [Actinobacteria bacterium]|nr:hypothetical protein [Actinomycetota bacterium]
MSQNVGPFTAIDDRRAGDASALVAAVPVPTGYVPYGPTRSSTPDHYFFALAVLHALRCASSAVDASQASRLDSSLAVVMLPLALTLAHAALVFGCHRQRRWAKVGSILLDVQASLITVLAILLVSDSGLGSSELLNYGLIPALSIWLAVRARVDRRRRR